MGCTLSKPYLPTNRQLLQLVTARYGLIGLHGVAVLAAEYWFNFDFAFVYLKAIVLSELVFNGALHYFYRAGRNATSIEYLAQILADILFLSLLLYFSGGATNPFVSLLLLPVAIGAVTLSRSMLLVVTLAALVAYSALITRLSPHQMHMMDMQQHFIGMWLNFVLSAMVVVLIVASLATAMRRQEKFVSQLREEQLRQEQLVALGTAAAQFAHQLATPLATVNLLAEELQDHTPHNQQGYLAQLQQQIVLCSKRLDDFRGLAEDVKHNVKREITLSQLNAQLQQEVQLNFADVEVDYLLAPSDKLAISCDTSLLPALLNLIQNAVQASKRNLQRKISVHSELLNARLVLKIRDFGPGLSQDIMLALGSTLVKSENGLGMGVMLSHATLERLGAQLKLYNHQQGGAVAEISMDVIQ